MKLHKISKSICNKKTLFLNKIIKMIIIVNNFNKLVKIKKVKLLIKNNNKTLKIKIFYKQHNNFKTIFKISLNNFKTQKINNNNTLILQFYC